MARQRKLPNGYARRHGCRASDVDAGQLRIGTAVEMEHTRDRKIARQIALDHLCENKRHKYYVRSNVRHERLLLKRNALAGHGDTCSTSPRWVRGGVGMLLGTLLGGMIGGGIALAVTTANFDITEPVDTVNRAKNMAVLAAIATALGATSGLTVGVWKPEC